MIEHTATKVTGSKRGSSQTDRRILEVRSHLDLGFNYLVEDCAEGFLESVGLLLQKLVSLLGSNSFRLVESERPRSRLAIERAESAGGLHARRQNLC